VRRRRRLAGKLQLPQRSPGHRPGRHLPPAGVTTHPLFGCGRRRLRAHRRSWPLARDLAPSPALADALDADLTHPQETIRRRSDTTTTSQASRRPPDDRAPPLDAVACAALLTTADRLLTLEAPRTLTPHLRHLLGHNQRRLTRQGWARQFVTVRPDCSEGLRHAFAPILQTYARPGRGRGLRTMIRRVPFGPEHIPQFLQDDWYQQHLAHFDGINTAQLRRTAALHLCQTAMGGSIREAASSLGLPDTRKAYRRSYFSVSTVHAWARLRSDPHEFEAAVHDIADRIEATPQPTDYHAAAPPFATGASTPQAGPPSSTTCEATAVGSTPTSTIASGTAPRSSSGPGSLAPNVSSRHTPSATSNPPT
jgi:hypothetical protein